MTTRFHAVLIDETGCEFGASVEASDHATARAKLREDYPESRIDQLESPAESAERERRYVLDWEREERERAGYYGEED